MSYFMLDNKISIFGDREHVSQGLKAMALNPTPHPGNDLEKALCSACFHPNKM